MKVHFGVYHPYMIVLYILNKTKMRIEKMIFKTCFVLSVTFISGLCCEAEENFYTTHISKRPRYTFTVCLCCSLLANMLLLSSHLIGNTISGVNFWLMPIMFHAYLGCYGCCSYHQEVKETVLFCHTTKKS